MATAAATIIVPLVVGIDFGGVLSIHDKSRTSEEDEHQSVEINMPDAMTSLIKLKESGHKLYLISYCGERRARETKRALLKLLPRKDLFDGLYFAQRTSNKVDVCRALGCDLMIDDRLKTLKHIYTLIPTIKLLWFSSAEESQPPNIIKVNSWTDIIKTIDEVLIHEVTRHKPVPRAVLDDKIHMV